MRVLGIDSSTQEASVALIEDGALRGEERYCAPNREISMTGKRPNNHSEIILPMLETLLKKTRTVVGQLAAIAVSVGPGSFTGLRIGLATAKGLAYQSGIPLTGVSTLLANARRVLATEALIASLLDARRGEVYCAVFRSAQRDLSRVTEDLLMPLDAAIQLFQSQQSTLALPITFVGDGATVHERRLLEIAEHARIVSLLGLPSIASEVAKIGLQNLVQAETCGDIAIRPMYLRGAAAEVKNHELTCEYSKANRVDKPLPVR